MARTRRDLALDDAFMRGFGIALASIWKIHHDGSMVRSIMKDNGFQLASFRDIGLLDSDFDAIRAALGGFSVTE